MALTKRDVIEQVNQLGFNGKGSYEIVETFLEIIKQRLKDDEDVLVSGFGKFTVQEKTQRKARHPVTDEDILIDARKVVVFKCSGKLKSGSTMEKVTGTVMNNHHRFLLPAGYAIVFITAGVAFLVLIAMDIAGIRRTALKNIPVTILLVLLLRKIRSFHRNKYNLILQYRGHHENF